VDPILLDLLYDPQTSGGLLIAVGAAAVEQLLAELQNAGVPAVRVGRVVSAASARVVVI